MIQSNKNPFEGAPIIYSYTRKQAIEDGVLVDLTEWAKETGFTIPVACTATVWHKCIEAQQNSENLGECDLVRSFVLLWTLLGAIRRHPESLDMLMFELNYIDKDNKPETIKLKAVCGPGDQSEPVITVMLPSED